MRTFELRDHPDGRVQGVVFDDGFVFTRPLYGSGVAMVYINLDALYADVGEDRVVWLDQGTEATT